MELGGTSVVIPQTSMVFILDLGPHESYADGIEWYQWLNIIFELFIFVIPSPVQRIVSF